MSDKTEDPKEPEQESFLEEDPLDAPFDPPIDPEMDDEEEIETGDEPEAEGGEDAPEAEGEPEKPDPWDKLREEDPEGYDLAVAALEREEQAKADAEKAKEEEAKKKDEPSPEPEDDFESQDQSFEVEDLAMKAESEAERAQAAIAKIEESYTRQSRVVSALKKIADSDPDDAEAVQAYRDAVEDQKANETLYRQWTDYEKAQAQRQRLVQTAKRHCGAIPAIAKYPKDYLELVEKGEIKDGMTAKQRVDAVLAHRAAKGKSPGGKKPSGAKLPTEDERRKRILAKLKKVKPTKPGGKSPGAGSPGNAKKDYAGWDRDLVEAAQVEI